MDNQTGLLPSITGWLQQPFNASGSALNWFLFVGFFLVVSLFWSRVLADLQRSAG